MFFKKVLTYLMAPTPALIATAFIVGLGGGFGAVIFRWLIQFFTRVFFHHFPQSIPGLGKHTVILIPAVGAILFSPLIYFFAREAKGHGVPEVMEAMELRGGKIRSIVVIIKAVASSLCIGSGGSVGREGPIVQIGSALGSTVGQTLRFSEERVKNLVACGAASGIAATFNAPIGGVIFALEIILRDFSTRRLAAVVIASVIASVIGQVFLGTQPSITVPPYTLRSPIELLFYLGFGFLLVPFCIVFIKLIYKFEDAFNKLPLHELGKPVIGGLLLGSIGFFYPQVFGVGYSNIEKVVHNLMPLELMLILIPMKIVAVSLTLGSGGSGGIFAPSLIIGALIGGCFGTSLDLLFPDLGIEPGAYALVGMGAFFAGAAHAPITSILILFELTGDYLIILPLMLSVIITTIASERLHPESIYTLKLVRRGINIGRDIRYDLLSDMTVKEIVMKEIPTVKPSANIDEILLAFESGKRGAVAVVENDGTFHGLITIDDILTSLKYHDSLISLVVAEDLAKKGKFVTVKESLNEALRKFLEIDDNVLPVLKTNKGKITLIGIISRHDLLSAYSRKARIT